MRPAPQLLDSGGEPVACAWRFPGVGTALAGALFLHRLLTVQSRGGETRRVDWAQSSALMVRREAAAAVGYLDPDFFVYYDECDFCKRLGRGRLERRSSSPPPRRSTTTSSRPTSPPGLPRIVEFHRNRDLYMRKHHSRAAALAVRVLTAWSYALRALGGDRPPRPPRAGLLGPRAPGAPPRPRRRPARPRRAD